MAVNADFPAKEPSLKDDILFLLKSSILILRRQIQNTLQKPPRFRKTSDFANFPIAAVSESALWNPDDNTANRLLTAGKIQNLRIAAQKINGLEIPAGSLFSFWKQLGKPSRLKGYTIGREIREGCLIPGVGGGLCQLSNALYDAALKAGCAVTERHRHSKIIPGSLAEQNRDATVKWNYVDLRFRSEFPLCIEAGLTADKLIVTFKSNAPGQKISTPGTLISKPDKMNDCYSCGNDRCFKSKRIDGSEIKYGYTTFILDEYWPEYEKYVLQNSNENDLFLFPGARLLNKRHRNWNLPAGRIIFLNKPALYRALYLKYISRSGKNIFAAKIRTDKVLAHSFAKHIPVESSHLVVSQNLLPFLREKGILGGRTFDVLMTRLPAEKLQETLDNAYARYSESKTLNDFRINSDFIVQENNGLSEADHIITPHLEIAAMYKHKTIIPDWQYAGFNVGAKARGNKILFPASALGRKGAFEMRRLAREMQLSLVIGGRVSEEEDFWKGVHIEYAGADPFKDIGLVIYPAWVEHQPRMILKALASGILVIASKSCGLQPMENLTLIETGNYNQLREAVLEALLFH
jgi:hypothetical protein